MGNVGNETNNKEKRGEETIENEEIKRNDRARKKK